jgi:hypothetical protein
VNATATGTLAEEHFDPTWVAASSSPAAPEVALAAAVRLRAALTGLGLAALALAVATVLALLIVAGPFHTSLGSLG